MISFKCYNMRVANLKAYFVFYDNYFLKILAAGQTFWKENMEDGAEENLAHQRWKHLHYCAWRIRNRIGCMRQRFYKGQSK
jgi:hypothetical protein